MDRPYIVAIVGGSGSGKTTFAKKLNDFLELDVTVISQDNYYIDQSNKFDFDGGSVNFDHPDSIDFDLLDEHLKSLLIGNELEIPIYEFATHKRLEDKKKIDLKPIVIVDGTLIMNHSGCLERFDLIVFIDVPEDIRFERRLHRDTVERGRQEEGVIRQFKSQVAPMHDLYIEPHKEKAHIIVNLDDFNKKIVEVSRLLNSFKGKHE